MDSNSSLPESLVLLPVLLSVCWILFDLFYASWTLGFVVNTLANIYLRVRKADSGIHIGALRINLLTGRILFKELHYYCRDFSVRVTDGYLLFRWWTKLKGCSCCGGSCCHGNSKKQSALVFLQLNGFVYHWYSRSDVYDRWGRTVVPDPFADSDANPNESGTWGSIWMELKPSIYFTFNKFKIYFGNHLVERTLVLSADKADAYYSTTDPSNPYDDLMSVIEWTGTNVQMVLEPSAGYEGPDSESPPPTSEGGGSPSNYLVMKTDSGQCVYSVDSPGLVPLGESPPPKFAFSATLGNNTVINYGCYVNRQRAMLHKFFFPNDYIVTPISEHPQPGMKRIYTQFDISVHLASPAVLNVPFKNQESISHLSIKMDKDSVVSIAQPWTTGPDGSTSIITGRLNCVSVMSSLDYQYLAEAETVELSTSLHFPRAWNATQKWDMKLSASEVEANILFSYIDFVSALLDDWVGTEPSDLLKFVPFDWSIAADLRQFEIYLFTNRYNWIDKDGLENSRLAFCGTKGQIGFELPFTEFLPLVQKISFTADGENIVGRKFVPPSCSTRESIFALSSSNKHRWRVLKFEQPPDTKSAASSTDSEPPAGTPVSSSLASTPSLKSKPTPSMSTVSSSSVAASSRPKVSLTKMSSLDLDSGKEKSSHFLEAPRSQSLRLKTSFSSGQLTLQDTALLRPSSAMGKKAGDESGGGGGTSGDDAEKEFVESNELFPMGYCGETKHENGWLDFVCGPSISIAITYHSHLHDTEACLETSNGTSQVPNLMCVDVDSPKVLFRVFGCLARDLLGLKENYPGEYINFTPFNSTVSYAPSTESRRDPKPPLVDHPPGGSEVLTDSPDEPKERFLNVVVDFKLRELVAEFPTHLPENYPRDFPLPSGSTSVLSIHVEYVGRETKVLLHLDPFTANVPSVVLGTSGSDPSYELGHLSCPGLDLKCHGFTEFMCGERVEYAWLMQLDVKKVVGALSTDQLLQVLDWFHTAILHTLTHGDGFQEAPNPLLIEPKVEPWSEDIKYRLFDLSISDVDLSLLEDGAITRIQCPGFDLNFCTLHSEVETLGLSLQLQGVSATSFVSLRPDSVLECAVLDIGNVQGDMHLREPHLCVPHRQMEFLQKADSKTQRLWFLWRGESMDTFLCGCCGGCLFYDGCLQRPQAKEQEGYRPEAYFARSKSGSYTHAEAHTLRRSSAVQSLRRNLLLSSVKDFDFVTQIHRGLLDYYETKYFGRGFSSSGFVAKQQPCRDDGGNVPEISVQTPSGKHPPGAIVSPSSESDTSSFKSALSSLVGEDFTDDNNTFTGTATTTHTGALGVLDAGTSPSLVRPKLAKRKISDIAEDVSAEQLQREGPAEPTATTTTTTGKGSGAEQQQQHTPDPTHFYADIAPSSLYRPVVLHAQMRKLLHESSPRTGGRGGSGGTPHHTRNISSASATGTTSYSVGGVDPSPTKAHSKGGLTMKMKLPVLVPLSLGHFPRVVKSQHPKAKQCRKVFSHGRLVSTRLTPCREDELAKVSLSIYLNGNVTATFTPLFLKFVEKFMNSLSSFFETRSALGVLDLLSSDGNGAVMSVLEKILDSRKTPQLPLLHPPPPPSPLLHFSVQMAHEAFWGLHFLQSPLERARSVKKKKNKPPPPPSSPDPSPPSASSTSTGHLSQQHHPQHSSHPHHPHPHPHPPPPFPPGPVPSGDDDGRQHLTEIAPHHSLLSCYVSGVVASAVVHSDTEVRPGPGGLNSRANVGSSAAAQEASPTPGLAQQQGSSSSPMAPQRRKRGGGGGGHGTVEVVIREGNGDEDDRGEEEDEEEEKTLLSTLKISSELNIPVLQCVLAALLPPTDKRSKSLGFSHQCSNLNYVLSYLDKSVAEEPSRATCQDQDEEEREGGRGEETGGLLLSQPSQPPPQYVWCGLFEMGVKDIAATFVAKVLHSEVSEKAILLWSTVHNHVRPSEGPAQQSEAASNNKLVIAVAVPHLWSHVSTPLMGIPTDDSTGGLDLLVLSDALDAWEPRVSAIAGEAKRLLEKKEEREKKVLLTLLAIANTPSQLYTKVGSPLHSKLSSSLRGSVVYCTVAQLWRVFHLFNEELLLKIPKDQSCDSAILALTLSLASRLFIQMESAGERKERLENIKRRMTLIPTDGDSVSYESISPSPSQLALPNTDYCGLELVSDVDYDQLFAKVHFVSLVVIREAVLPLARVVGVRALPQLRPLRHVSSKVSADFNLQLREVTMFDTVTQTSMLYLEQLSINGCLTHSEESNMERYTNYLSLLLVQDQQQQQQEEERVQKSWRNVSTKFCVSVESIVVTLTVPLLKLVRHTAETGRFRSAWKKKRKNLAPEGLMFGLPPKDSLPVVTPPAFVTREEPLVVKKPSVKGTAPTSSGGDEAGAASSASGQEERSPATPNTPAHIQQLDVWVFSQTIASILQEVERRALTNPNQDVISLASSFRSGRIVGSRITDFATSPHFPRSNIILTKTPESHPYLSIHTADSHSSDSKRKESTSIPIPSVKQRDANRKQQHVLASSASNTSLTSTEQVGGYVHPSASVASVAINIDNLENDPVSGGAHNYVLPTSHSRGSFQDDTYGETTDNVLSSDNDPNEGSTGGLLSSSGDGYLASPPTGTRTRTGTGRHSSPSSPGPLGGSGSIVGISDTFLINRSLALSEKELLFSIFGLLKVGSVQFNAQVETVRAVLELREMSGSVDVRKASDSQAKTNTSANANANANANAATVDDAADILFDKEALPTYLSVAITLKKSLLKIMDRGLHSELAQLLANPIYCSVGICNTSLLQKVPSYRCLLRLTGLELDVKQPPIVMHSRFNHLMPAFNQLYKDVFANTSLLDPSAAAAPFHRQSATSPIETITSMKFPSHLPLGFVHCSLDRFSFIMTPLPSLSVVYTVSPISAQVESARQINFSLLVGDHSLKFNPKQHKDELSLRLIALPNITLRGDVRAMSPPRKTPRLSMELIMKEVNIDLSTDVLNQLLILQNTFIKEVNELIQMFVNIGDQIPRERLATSLGPEAVAESAELLSMLESCKFQLQGICITVSTPLSTALRFSTGKIDMTITSNHPTTPDAIHSVAKSQLSLSGKVDIDISLALGYLQDTSPDVVDDFVELAYFRTKISIRNKQQTTRQTSVAFDEDFIEHSTSEKKLTDTYVISIVSPHLFIQSSGVEKAIMFWLNCKSVYTFWQNERKMLNAEIQAATEAVIEKFERFQNPSSQLHTPSIDFSKPRLVQISVHDMGVCMPLIHTQQTTPQPTQKVFPALVVTIKEMQLSLSLNHGRVASTGKFDRFCVRFAEQFYIRHKTWTIDLKKHKFNTGIIHSGTFKLCIASKKKHQDGDKSKPVQGEKLLAAFRWYMSGIDVSATTNIGHHLETLVKTMTAIGSDFGETQVKKRTRSPVNLPPSKSQVPKPQRRISTPKAVHHRRTASLVSRPTAPVIHLGTSSPPDSDPNMDPSLALETDLARQTRKVQRLKWTGAAPDNLKMEKDTLHQMELDLVKNVRKVFRRRKGLSLYQLNQIFSPKAMSAGKTMEEYGGKLRKKISTMATSARKRLFSHTESLSRENSMGQVQEEMEETESYPGLASKRRPKLISGHHRYRSDISDLLKAVQVESPPPTPGPGPPSTPTPSIVEGEEDLDPISEPPKHKQGPRGTWSHSEGGTQEDAFIMPSIDVELNVTIEVDTGKIILHSNEAESVKSLSSSRIGKEQQQLEPSVSPRPRFYEPPSKPLDTVILIPAFDLKVHYQSIMGKKYMYPLSSSLPGSPIKAPSGFSKSFEQHTTTTTTTGSGPSSGRSSSPHENKTRPMTLDAADEQAAEDQLIKKGVLSVTAIISSLPDDLQLTPSFLEFIEQVARPTIAATVVSSPSSSDTESDTETKEDLESSTLGKSKAEGESTKAISYPMDVTIMLHILPSKVLLTCKPHSRVECLINSPSVSIVVSFSLFSHLQLESSALIKNSPETTSLSRLVDMRSKTVTFNNLYVTGCLSTFALQLYSPQVSTLKLLDRPRSENKEALSLTLGQAFIHLSRKMVLAPTTCSARKLREVRSVDDYSLHNKLQVSVIMDIASLVFGYDMKRLNDITAFRRYWYRTSLVEALFIGSKQSPESAADERQFEVWSPSTSEDSNPEPSSIVELEKTTTAVIVVAANVEDFRVSANFAQVMGNIDILVTHLKLEGHADVQHNELMLLNVDGSMERGEVDARGGVIAGSILAEEVGVQVTTDIHDGNTPFHKASAVMKLIEGRIDYMSSCIVLIRAGDLNIAVYDCWKGLQTVIFPEPPEEPSSIQALVDFTWDKLQVSIHRSTTKSMLSIVQRLTQFVMQQKRRSERTIRLMVPDGTVVSRLLDAYQKEQKRAEEEKKEEAVSTHNHWLWGLKAATLELIQMLGFRNQHFVSLGGKLSIAGQNICIVCFHGTSFRETEWAVFNIEKPNVGFSTQTMPGLDISESSLRVVAAEGGRRQQQRLLSSSAATDASKRHVCQQTCTIHLGDRGSESVGLAGVYRVTCNTVPPITGTNIHDWLSLVALDHHFHPADQQGSAHLKFTAKYRKKLGIHQILSVPSLELELKNDHFLPLLSLLKDCGEQATLESLMGAFPVSPKAPPSLPCVECSLCSHFFEGISVTTTVDHYLFLHDLIWAYVDYLDKHKDTATGSATEPIPSADESPLQQQHQQQQQMPADPNKSSPSPHGQQPLVPMVTAATATARQFSCVHWELNPQLKLLSNVASGNFNPHINWLLERLGFKNARTTIPKWVQRGAMDLGDEALSFVVELLVKISATKKLHKMKLSRAATPDT